MWNIRKDKQKPSPRGGREKGGGRSHCMKIAYLDCFSGISGDMLIGALIDAGFPIEELRRVLQSLPLEGYSLEVTRRKGTISLAPVSKSR